MGVFKNKILTILKNKQTQAASSVAASSTPAVTGKPHINHYMLAECQQISPKYLVIVLQLNSPLILGAFFNKSVFSVKLRQIIK